MITGEVLYPELPATGDTALVVALAAMAIIAAFILVLAALKRRSSKQ